MLGLVVWLISLFSLLYYELWSITESYPHTFQDVVSGVSQAWRPVAVPKSNEQERLGKKKSIDTANPRLDVSPTPLSQDEATMVLLVKRTSLVPDENFSLGFEQSLVELDGLSVVVYKIAATEANSIAPKNHRSANVSQTSGRTLRPPTPKGSGDTQRTTPQKSTHKALVIGIDSRILEERHNLRYAARDASRFSNCLIDKMGFKRENVCVLTDSDRVEDARQDGIVSREMILQKLGWLFENAGPDDVLVLFISGHCVLNDKNQIVSLVAVEPNARPCYIPSTLFRSFFNKLPLGCTVEVLLDCCHSAGLVKLPHVIKQMSATGEVTANVAALFERLSAGREPCDEPSAASKGAPDPLVVRGSELSTSLSLSAADLQHTDGIPKAPKKTHLSHGVADAPFRSTGQKPVTPPPSRSNRAPLPNRITDPSPAALMAGPKPDERVSTAATVIVWAAAGLSQWAWESARIGSENPKNGVFTHAICTALESTIGGLITRKTLWDAVCLRMGLENYSRSHQKSEAQDQLPEILCSHNEPDRIMGETTFKISFKK